MRQHKSMAKAPVPPAPKRCKLCGLKLIEGVKCLHGAEPGRDLASVRAANAETKRKLHAARVASERVHLTREEERRINANLLRVDPLYAHGHRIAQKAGLARRRYGKSG